MPDPSSESPLERMRKRLYAPKSVDSIAPQSLPSSAPRAPERWASEAPVAPKGPKISGTALFLGGSLAFFLLAAGVTTFMLFLGGRSVSGDKVEITIEGPTTVSGGEAVPLLVTVRNENPVAISGAVLRLTFPEGTGEAENPSVPLSFYEEELGDIAAGGTVRRTVRASFFGAEDQVFLIPITVEYVTASSNAVFTRDASYELVVSNAPVIVAITALSEVPSGQLMTMTLSVRSNATTPLGNVAVLAEYPFGFNERSAEPEREGGSYFVLGTLAPGEEREIRIGGFLSGQEGEERVFRFTAGSLKAEGSRSFAVAYTEKETTIAIAKPFLTVGLALDRSEEATIIAKAGQDIIAQLAWENALQSVVQDAKIEVKLSGDALDASDVEATNGFYRSSDRTVLFDKDSAAGLASLDPGEFGNGSFSFHTKSGSAMSALRNPSITLDVSISGRRIGESRVPEQVSSTLKRVVKFQTDLTLFMRTMRTTGAFTNTGPWPPKVDQETTYTIELAAENTVNGVGGAKASMTLPSYVRFTGQVSPAGSVTYNESTREVSWAIGDFAAGTTKKASFQVALLPSVSQKGTSPALVGDAVLRGFDRFVQKDAESRANSVDIQAFDDPAYNGSLGVVEQ